MQGDPGYGYGGYGYGYTAGAGGYNYDMASYGGGGAYHTANDQYPAAPATYEDPLAGRRQHDFPAPLTGLEFQATDTCPKNYVIFDQTYDRSRVMFHPSLANNLGSSGGGYGHDHGCYGYDQNYAGKGAYYGDGGGTASVRQKEDTDEIDALMSTEDGEDEDDVRSTGRTPGCGGAGGSPDSTCSSGGGGQKKKERMKKMVRTLKGIVPGGDRMDTPAVLDEAVRYLKSLKVEAKKLGARGSSS
ncbi:hypothetical protein SEVIR_1G140900v4 [Setaria viridis]|uniref:BHLH domain-containing protein n=2 Tax=Setaria TaxID=4554 RepID=A0A368PK62_SETIT|nr:transcription factor bHLH144 [Setaria italica]XP_004952351.1 transcription factor bHLH144 [Setaria italica]XP_034579962.1 transcription factor bHLH144-like [Setaria viridis]XP_034580041.1 transcription factor bHLH144-like [Setaria viridis]RCV06176.1 hypothetical protein SETIT_1G142400v2 [Setaria italica]RCV06177.1 hypothetical protein SETIT_1G142400v2 [Setaria italica]TKW38832.1 hypothetical protein SEVIR_1G140900v2 [Setaria viridis]TKW38833.1 hypothetical protein SEVIR_1G140900v2 [Setari